MLQIFHLIKGRGVTQAAGREPTDVSLRFGIRFQWRPMLPGPDDDISFRNGNRKSSGNAFADASRRRKNPREQTAARVCADSQSLLFAGPHSGRFR
jgi:hypothetical protein